MKRHQENAAQMYLQNNTMEVIFQLSFFLSHYVRFKTKIRRHTYQIIKQDQWTTNFSTVYNATKNPNFEKITATY